MAGSTDARTATWRSGVDTLGALFSSRIRAILLAFLVPRLGSGYSLTELSRALGVPISSLQHECYKLERLGILDGQREGVSRRYRIVTGNAANRTLIDLVIVHLGLVDVVRESLRDLDGLDAAFIAGEIEPRPRPPLHLVLIGDVSLEVLEIAQERVTHLMGVEPDDVQLAFFGTDDWHRHRESDPGFRQRIADMPTIDLVVPAA